MSTFFSQQKHTPNYGDVYYNKKTGICAAVVGRTTGEFGEPTTRIAFLKPETIMGEIEIVPTQKLISNCVFIKLGTDRQKKITALAVSVQDTLDEIAEILSEEEVARYDSDL